MKLLRDILYKAGIEEVVGTTNVAVTGVCIDSRKVRKDSLFIAVRGTQTDGHDHIPQALEQGAAAIVCERMPEQTAHGVTYVQVRDARQATGVIACNFYDNPSEKLKLVGVTGTNGKTTTATLLYNLFRGLGYKVGLLSTVRNLVDGEELESTHTTPDAISLNLLLDRMVKAGCSHCFMEVSSHALHQQRVAGIRFEGAIFTNITHDHLDYHGTFNDYIAAKKMLFDMLPQSAFAVVNLDDRNGDVMIQNTRARVITYGMRSLADRKVKILENNLTGLVLNLDGSEVTTRLIGAFNASNLVAVYTAALELREDRMQVLTVLSDLRSVDGRFDFVRTADGIIGIVDYAHTPDALKNVLGTIQDLRTGNETVLALVGCGGDRDRTKRPEMARIGADNSDRLILTSDNPRSEDPEAILAEMRAGLDPVQMKKTLVITDRAEAIRTACAMAKAGDIILVAGKGHEKYQEVKGVKHPFDDLQMLKENLNTIG